MATNTEFTVANLEFDSIKSNLKTFLEGQDVFKDYDFVGSSLNVLLDVLAYNTYYNGVYLNHVASEMFLDSAQLRDSVYSISKSLNYLPRSYRSSVAYVDIDVNPTSNPHKITIPRLTSFTTTVGDNTYTFSTNSSISVLANNNYIASNVAIYEGEIIQEAFVVTNTSPNTSQFFINNFDVDVTSLEVKVRTSNTDSTNATYTRANTLFGLTGTSNVYFVEPSTNGSYKVVFGNGTFGRNLANNNLVELSYRVSSGADPNGANSFSADSVAGHPASITLASRAAGGSIYQNLDDIKFAAPRSLSVQERAVTKEDYKTLVTNEFGDISSVHVYGGEEENPPKFGFVKVALRSDNFDVLPTGQKEQIKNFLKPKMPIGMRAEIIDADFVNVKLSSIVKADLNATSKTPPEINELVSDTIVTFNTDNLDEFDTVFRKSKLIEKINETDSSIVSNELEVHMVKSISPVGNQRFDKVINFNNALKIDNPIDESIQDQFVPFSTPAVTSETFTFDGVTGASIRDDGAGTLHVTSYNKDSNGVFDYKVLNNNIGTVNYETGELNISNLTINSYSSGTLAGSLIITANPRDDDIAGAKNDVVRIRTDDTTVTITELRL